MHIQTTTYDMALQAVVQATLQAAMQAAFSYGGTTPCLTTFANLLCTQANTYSLSAGEKAQLIKSVCDELTLLLQEGLK